MFDTRQKPKMVEKAFLVGVYFNKAHEEYSLSLLDELSDLVETLGINVISKNLVYVRKSNRGYLVGSGKTEKLIQDAKKLNSDCIIFDNELTPSQQRNWEEKSNITVIDREEVILDIFHLRAQTSEAKLQVELAIMMYSLPRLTKMWSHLGRQRSSGGKGASRGEGEQQIEVDRRLARRKIVNIKKELQTVRLNRKNQRKLRTNQYITHASLVGYTNSGKSTIFNLLSQTNVLAEDKLFATLDPTTRKILLDNGQPLLLTDTVGFIRSLPHRLIEAFKSTLEEAMIANFLIHVLDASSPEILPFYETTINVLEELGASNKKNIILLNKIDLIPSNSNQINILKNFFRNHEEVIFFSAKNKEGLPELMSIFSNITQNKVINENLKIPQTRQDLISLIYREGKVLETSYVKNDVILKVLLPKKFVDVFKKFIFKNDEIK